MHRVGQMWMTFSML